MAPRKGKGKGTHYPLIPEEERKCVWMATGLISYKLCDRNYQCEQCRFDQAIKHQEGSAQGVHGNSAEGSSLGDPSAGINGSLFYHPDHCWVKVETCETARMGIDDLVSRLITKVKVVILPEVGSVAAQGDCCAHIIEDDHILPVISPLSGIVQAVNLRLKKEPGLISDDPRGAGWLIAIKPDNLEGDLKNLLFGREALLWRQGKEREIIAQSDSLLRRDFGELGLTMQDGGVVMSSLEDMLKVMNPLQRAQILDFSINRPRDSRPQGDDPIRSEFVAMIAHELRAPVATVVQQLSVILGNMAGELNETQKQLIARAKDRTQGILLLIRDLLDLSKAEAGKMAPYREPLSLSEVILSVVKTVESEAQQKNIQIECFRPSSLASVQADRTAMESLFTNIIYNAVKYTGSGGKVTINLRDEGNLVKIAVTDTGIGIKKEDIPRIFDKFYRVKSPETRHIAGTGLGLAIVKSIVDDHLGSISVESVPGRGTTFTVFLPKAGDGERANAKGGIQR
jgi:signal transduction histidine kinase